MKYVDIVFLQGDEADEYVDMIDDQGEDIAMDRLLLDFDYGGGEVREMIGDVPWGTGDKLYRRDDLVMAYNTGLPYIGLTRIIEE